MPHISRTALLPTLTALALLAVGCSATGTSEPSDGEKPAARSTTSAQDVPDSSAAGQLTVGRAPAASATPTAVSQAAVGGRRAQKSSLKITSFDRRSGRAVVSAPARSEKATPSGRPSRTPGAGGGADDQGPLAVGDVVASGPAPGAPDGVLAKVTDVLGTTEHNTEVQTAPTTLSALLGSRKAAGKVPVDPASVQVEPLVKGVKVSWSKNGGVHSGPRGTSVPLGNLRLDVGAAIATAPDAPASAAASLSGFVQLAPEVEFSYNGADGAGSPGGAYLGLSGDWSSQWQLKGQAAAHTPDGKPLRLPFAKLHADPVIQVGPVPVVVNLDLTCYAQVDADGRVSVEVKEDLKGDFRVGGSYSRAKGWQAISESDIKASPVKATVAAAGKVKAALGAEATLGLYGVTGVTAELTPYLRGEAEGSATGAGDGSGSAVGHWLVAGGVDLSGALLFHLKIFGTPVFEKRIPLGALHREWKLAEGGGSASSGKRGR
ncbi:hypothetical protein FCH28_07595 [Streptomyces piniterrae]|uniref:Lipoprotein n=1 Tax=Streptomyces piniterrae TaxID=2571125 RepID=A0A4U0NRT0_9ACTN|nr:hypothetical protein [Streptomyces piniterrae]TJZ57286.1 hypothetical protein FCH28_07595 [Streptomyces piniterrae]